MRGLGGEVEIDPTPQEVSWTVPLDEDDENATYDAEQVGTSTPPPARPSFSPSSARHTAAAPRR